MGLNYIKLGEAFKLARDQFSDNYLHNLRDSRLYSEDFQLFYDEEGVFVGTNRNSTLNDRLGFEKIRKSRKIPQEIENLERKQYISFLESFEEFSEKMVFKENPEIYSWELDQIVKKLKKVPPERKKDIFADYLKKYKLFKSGLNKVNKLGSKLGFNLEMSRRDLKLQPTFK